MYFVFFRPLLTNIIPLPASPLDISFNYLKDMFKLTIQDHQKDIDYENPRDFIDVYLTEMKTNPNFDEEHLVVLCLDFFQAGSETTSTTLLWVVIFMTLYPKVQEKCHKEISDQIGTRPPMLEDSKSLIYVNATLIEIQRLAIVAPGSLPHILMKDTSTHGYEFKAGTIFSANLTKYLMDPVAFPNPEEFKPERFLDGDQKIKKIEHFVPFGIGKRICMGESLARNELFIFFVRLIQRVNFQPTQNKPSVKNYYPSGITRIPKPFEVKVVSNFQ